MNIEQSLEALLFWKGEPMSLKELAKSLSEEESSVSEALARLEQNLQTNGRGLVLQSANQEYSLGTTPEASALIEKLTKEELSKDLGRASLETLSIVLYKGPVKRSEIDYIRGVNSSFILRNLLIRGLIEKKPAPNDNRTSVYSTSLELLSFLGISKVEDLPNFALVQEEINKFNEASEATNMPEVSESEINTTQESTAESEEKTSSDIN